jgi:hypothetical protein
MALPPITLGRFFVSAVSACVLGAALSGCGGGGAGPTPPVPPPATSQIPGNGAKTTIAPQTYDSLTGGPCEISYDGLLWYSVQQGPFPPIDVHFAKCSGAATLHVVTAPPIPAWAHPVGGTQAIFIATSLMEHPFSPAGVSTLHAIAAQAHVPVTWMIGNVAYLQKGNYEVFNQYHAQDGDDVESEHDIEFLQVGKLRFPWYTPEVSVEGAGHERLVAQALQWGEHGFWGITWDSLGIDSTSDRGAPWGTYCADASSYKRPSPTGNCTLVSFEWTARDLTRAYFSGMDDYFSTDPDDVLVRGNFGVVGGSAYMRALVDAYAAAGELQPLVMMSQQEAPEMIDGAAGDNTLMQALYTQAVSDGMKTMTLASALPVAQTFSNRPRAIAFPFIPGGDQVLRNGSTLDPGTIDYHDNVAGMTFVGGHATPARLFLYAQDPASVYNRPLAEFPSGQFPQLTMVAASKGRLYFHFHAQSALHYGVALWADPQFMGISGNNVSVSGRAAAVAVFDVPAGDSDQSVICTQCTTANLPLSL